MTGYCAVLFTAVAVVITPGFKLFESSLLNCDEKAESCVVASDMYRN